MLKIRRPLGRLIFNMGIAIPGKTVFLIETAPCLLISDIDYNSTSSQTKDIQLGLWIVRFVCTSLLFVIGIIAPGLPGRNYYRTVTSQDGDDEVCTWKDIDLFCHAFGGHENVQVLTWFQVFCQLAKYLKSS